jgi:multidrug efflux pump subunit AcrB
MAASVATPLEQQLSSIAGIDSMTSTSSLGSTSITLQFNLDRNIDGAAQDVQSAISAVQRRLPRDMPNPPSFRKSNPAEDSVLLLSLSSSTLSLSEVNEYAETILAQRISTVDGVSQVNVFGSQKYAVRVRLDPRALAARGIGIDEVRTALDTNNVNLPAGVIDGGTGVDTLDLRWVSPVNFSPIDAATSRPTHGAWPTQATVPASWATVHSTMRCQSDPGASASATTTGGRTRRSSLTRRESNLADDGAVYVWDIVKFRQALIDHYKVGYDEVGHTQIFV